MCGIAGVASPQDLPETAGALLDGMLRTLEHRGPHEQRAWSGPRASVGARRLAIIDLETGGQPACDEGGQVIVTQNGEIYNYIELRERLIQQGHRFRSKGDTEVIAHLYEEHGTDLVHHLRGMFAIAIWDVRRHRLMLARDRLGKKPIYWTADKLGLRYGSELKALLADPEMPREIDRVALAQYLEYGYIPAPRSIFRGIQKLPPASVLSWEDGAVAEHVYWEPHFGPKHEGSQDELRDECLRVLTDSVRLRLRSDVPLGLFLSGGIDSGLVLSCMAELSATPIRTFSIGFTDQEFDERGPAREVARHFGADHAEDVVDLDAASLLPDLTYHFDEPMGDSSALPTYVVAGMAGKELTVVLTGDGGDETFAGYSRYRLASFGRLHQMPAWSRRAAASAVSAGRRLRLGRQGGAGAELSLGDMAAAAPDDGFQLRMSLMDLDTRSALLDGPEIANQDEVLSRVLASGPSDPLDRQLRADLLTYLPGDLLVKMDRATMAHSVEARSPLLDQELVTFAARLPPEFKARNGKLKVMLRRMAADRLPPAIADRPKMGFAVPVDRWFRNDLGNLFRETVLSSDARMRDHISTEVASRLLDEHLSGARNHGQRLWLLLFLEMWGRRWLGMNDVVRR